MDTKYILKTMLFDCSLLVYLNVFIPIHFATSASKQNDLGTFYVHYRRFILYAIYQFALNFLYFMTLYLFKRNFEMQFNSHVLGSWYKVDNNNSVLSAKKEEIEESKKLMEKILKENPNISSNVKPVQIVDKEVAGKDKLKNAPQKEPKIVLSQVDII